MAENTPRLGLHKKNPVVDGNDTFNIKTMLNDNWDEIDKRTALINPETGKLLPGQENAVEVDLSGLATKQELQDVKDDAATHSTKKASETELGHVMVGEGLAITPEGKLKVTKEGVPSGAIIMWSGSITSIPTGWQLCNGQNGAPDLLNRFVVGAGGTYSVGAKGGADTVVLTTAQMPSHTHTGSTNTTGGHNHELRIGTGNSIRSSGSNYVGGADDDQYGGTKVTSRVPVSSDGAHSHTISLNNTGNGQAHENRPPYYALAYIMKL